MFTSAFSRFSASVRWAVIACSHSVRTFERSLRVERPADSSNDLGVTAKTGGVSATSSDVGGLSSGLISKSSDVKVKSSDVKAKSSALIIREPRTMNV